MRVMWVWLLALLVGCVEGRVQPGADSASDTASDSRISSEDTEAGDSVLDADGGPEICVPSCSGKACDEDDGCGAVCGCEPGGFCEGGECFCQFSCSDSQGNPYECGDDGCGGQCGACAENCVCQGHVCVCNYCNQVAFGGECQYLEDCQPYLDYNTYEPNPDFPFCNWDQCQSGGPCVVPYCTKSCIMHKDTLNNATGEAGGDGIEDSDTPQDDCVGAYDGPVGTEFRCVALLPADQLNPVFQCMPGTTFAACGASSDCPEGEACQLAYVNGVYETRCMTPVKETYKGGLHAGEACNSNKWSGKQGFCESGQCLSAGCSDFCVGDEDCMTSVDASCIDGVCSNNAAFACEGDVDCSAWTCREDYSIQGVLSGGEILFDVCAPKECLVSADCGDPGYFCRHSLNDEEALEDVAWEYLCLPRPKDGVALGENCDPFWQDDIDGPECGAGYCIEGFCSGVCLTDVDCAEDQLCTVREFGYDHDDDGSPDKVLPYQLCQSIPGSGTECMKNADCTLDGEACVMAEVPSDGLFLYELTGTCADLGDQKGVLGDFCGWGVGVQCKSGACLYFDEEAGFGLCAESCTVNADCPDMVTLTDSGGSYDYKTVCALRQWGYNGTLDAEDDLFLNHCWVIDAANSLDDCSAAFTCTEKENEACLPFVHSVSPEEPAMVEYACVSNVGDDDEGDPLPPPSRDVGDVCDPEVAGQCKGIYCLPVLGESGLGYCSRLCETDGDCVAGGPGMVCSMHVELQRPDPAMSAIIHLCQMEALR